MAGYQDPLSRVKVASPCTADWETMLGNERQRFCGQCQLNVYNLSGMTKREAENLISHAEGRLCVRFYRRADGTILTQNCPVGLRALKRRISRVATAALSTVLGFFSGLGLYTTMRETDQPAAMGVLAAQKSSEIRTTVKLKPDNPYPVVMGDMIYRPTEETPYPHRRSNQPEGSEVFPVKPIK